MNENYGEIPLESRNGASTCNADDFMKLVEARLQGEHITSSVSMKTSNIECSYAEKESNMSPSIPPAKELTGKEPPKKEELDIVCSNIEYNND